MRADTGCCAKFLFVLRNYGTQETLLLMRDFLWRRLAALRGMDRDALYTGVRYPSFPPDVAHLERSVVLHAATGDRHLPAPAVILHCYHVQLLEELLPWLENLPAATKCHVSTDTVSKKKTVENILSILNFSRLDVRVLPNRGFDIGPFFIGFRDVLQHQQIVLKIHCKLSPQRSKSSVSDWNNLLLTSLLGSKERVLQILHAFHSNSQLGVVAPGKPDILAAQGINHYIMQRLLAFYGIELPRDAAIDFPVGSMFWCRSRAMRPWLNLNFSFKDFTEAASSPRDGTLAHALERLIFFGCGLEGLHWGRVGA